MIQSERDLLFSRTSKYLSIGITEDGERRMSISVPWEDTCSAFNMNLPNVYLTEKDFEDEEIADRLKNFDICGCYIFTPLKDYSFLAQFTDIWDMYIEYGGAIRDLSFMRHMDWGMLYLEDARLENLRALFSEDRGNGICHRCLGLYHCQVKDISAVVERGLYMAELLIWPEKYEPEEKARWKKVRSGKFRYYKPKE